MKGDRNENVVRLTVSKTHLHLALGILIGFGFGYATSMALHRPQDAPSSADVSLPPYAALTRVPDVSIDGRPRRGPEDAPITIIEFTDYECPFCGRFFRETYRGLLAEYEGRVRYVIRNFPLSAIHPQAQKAAEAAECAHEQGRFWEYHDLLFERAPLLDVQSLKDYASEVTANAADFAECLDSGRHADVVSSDFADGLRYGVSATPTFFINGRMTSGALSLEQFKRYMDAALREVERAEGL